MEFTGDDLCPDDDDSEEDAELTYISKKENKMLNFSDFFGFFWNIT